MKKKIIPEPMSRDKLAKNLSSTEAGDLLVHSHKITPERRKALLLIRGPAKLYFSPEEITEIKKWMETETYFPRDNSGDWHPKAPEMEITMSTTSLLPHVIILTSPDGEEYCHAVNLYGTSEPTPVEPQNIVCWKS